MLNKMGSKLLVDSRIPAGSYTLFITAIWSLVIICIYIIKY